MSIIEEIAAERRRQVEAEGWTPGHDDQHDDGELAGAAAFYASFSRPGSYDQAQRFAAGRVAPAGWPWAARCFKPTSPRRMLIKAAALIVAEIERLDRASLKEASNG